MLPQNPQSWMKRHSSRSAERDVKPSKLSTEAKLRHYLCKLSIWAMIQDLQLLEQMTRRRVRKDQVSAHSETLVTMLIVYFSVSYDYIT